MRRLIATNSPFERKYGYSRAVVDEPFVFVSGVVGYEEGSTTLPPDIRRAAAVVRDLGVDVGARGEKHIDQLDRLRLYLCW